MRQFTSSLAAAFTAALYILDLHKLYKSNINTAERWSKQMKAEQMAANVQRASLFLKQLANENRLLILCALIEREMSVSEMGELVPLSQSSLSQHLASLRDAQLVTTRRQGTGIFYSIANPAVKAVIQVLHEQFCPNGISSNTEVPYESY